MFSYHQHLYVSISHYCVDNTLEADFSSSLLVRFSWTKNANKLIRQVLRELYKWNYENCNVGLTDICVWVG